MIGVMLRSCVAVTPLILIAAAPRPGEPPCRCRAQGMTATLGQTVCIPTPSGPRLARCDMALNNTSWTFLPGPCPQSMRDIGQVLSASLL